MLFNALRQLNWVDSLALILLIRISYVAIKNGFFVELLKFLGTLLAVYLSLHYYIVFSDDIASRIGLKKIPPAFLKTFIFVALAIWGYFIFRLLRATLSRFIQMETVPTLNKWGSFILGIGRGILGVSLIIFAFVISGFNYFVLSVQDAYTSKFFLRVAPATYSRLWNNVASKFMTQEKFNQTTQELQKNLEPKNKSLQK